MTPSTAKIITELGDQLRKSGTGALQLRGIFWTWDHSDEDVERVLEDINRALKGAGVYVVEQNTRDDYWHHTGLLYVDLGDPCQATIYFDTEKRRFHVGAWADFVDGRKKRFGTSASTS